MCIRDRSRIYIGVVCFLLLLSFSSCIDETFTNNNETESTFISIRGIGVQGNTHLGTDPVSYTHLHFGFTAGLGYFLLAVAVVPITFHVT